MAALNPTSPIDTATLSRCKLTYFVGFTNDFLSLSLVSGNSGG